MNNFGLRRILTITISLLLFIASFAMQPSALAQAIDPKLEQQVLQIIRNHPEVLQETLITYQQQQRAKYQQLLQDFAEQLQRNPTPIIGTSPTTGPINGKVLLLEFSDFQCPYCAEASKSLKQFLSKHGDRVTLIYKHFPLTAIHPQALPAAQAAWAAGQQGKFWQYHDALFEQQKQLSEALYPQIAQSLGLNVEKFNRDRTSTAATRAVQQDVQLAEKLRLEGTPTFFMGDRFFSGAVTLNDLESVLAEL